MRLKILASGKGVSWNEEAVVDAVAAFCEANNITTDAQFDTAVRTAIDGATGLNTATKTLLKTFFTKIVSIR